MKSDDTPLAEQTDAVSPEGAAPEPCLVETRQGKFSVFYKNRYLYSRIQPASSIEKIIQNLTLRPETLILCFSPVLSYGLELLLSLMPEKCVVLAIERDDQLYTLAEKSLPAAAREHPSFTMMHAQTVNDVLTRIAEIGLERFRRCAVVEMSAGAAFNADFYHSIVPLADEMIGRYWKNRVTLIKMGRLYAKNMFLNMARLPFTKPIETASIDRPIIVCGAGPSLDETLKAARSRLDRFHIIAVDSALVPLLKRGILPDAVVAVESQMANDKAFIGTAGTRIPLYMDMTSRPQLAKTMGGPAVFFFSDFADTGFLRRLKGREALPFTIPPLGSVGLAAMYLALALRKPGVPVYFTGLDFSFQPGKTHCRESPAHRAALDTSTRFHPAGDPAAAYATGTFVIMGKNNGKSISQPILSYYGQLFCARFSGEPNVFDAGPSGMNTGCTPCPPEQLDTAAEAWEESRSHRSEHTEDETDRRRKLQIDAGTIEAIFDEEENALKKLREALSSGNGTQDDILNILKDREYLYLHFPDGHLKPSLSTGYLKRIRSETDFFIKYIETARSLLRSMETN